MTCRLETERGAPVADPTEDDIAAALRGLDGDTSNFAVLSRAPSVFLQVNGSAADGFLMEYRESADTPLFRCSDDPVVLEVAEKIFIRYLQQDPAWKTHLSWHATDL